MGSFSYTRRVSKHGGSLVIPLPTVMAAVLGVQRGADVRILQPYADLVAIIRPESGLVGPLSVEARLAGWAVESEVYKLLDERFGGYQAKDPMTCTMCRDLEAAVIYSSIAVCPPCRRELAASVAFRRHASWGERELTRS